MRRLGFFTGLPLLRPSFSIVSPELRRPAALRRRARGFTIIELITVLVLAAILAAVAGARFFQRETFDARSLADQAVGMLRYAQKLAIAQNRPVYVRLDGKSVAVCFTAACDTPASRVVPPAGGNSGGKYTLQYCAGQSNWLCVGRPDALTLTSGAAGFFFDPLGRPYYTAFGDFAAAQALNVGGGGQQYTILVEAETGYVHR